MIFTFHRVSIVAARAFFLSIAAPACATGQHETKVEALPQVSAFSTQAVAGKTVGVLPITLVVADPAIQSDSLFSDYRDRRLALSRADSLISEALVTRGPEVGWVLPPELRKMARRAAGFVPDPDQMGQAILRSSKITVIPDPLRSSMRSLLAIADSRLAFVPAALSFSPEADGTIRADLPVVLADVRIGRVLWRSLALGRGRTPDEALNAALASVLPVSQGQ